MLKLKEHNNCIGCMALTEWGKPVAGNGYAHGACKLGFTVEPAPISSFRPTESCPKPGIWRTYDRAIEELTSSDQRRLVRHRDTNAELLLKLGQRTPELYRTAKR